VVNGQSLFDFAAYVGLTKHLGGVDATDDLLEMCRVGEDSYVLDVGCGAGVTPCYIAREYGCRVVGVDIKEKMIERCRERAQREGVQGKTRFEVADAQDLPFDGELFDAVITESAAAFPPDKEKAVREYVRVAKAGGYVGLNEATWLKLPPPPEVVAWASQDLGGPVKLLSAEQWVALLEGAGLRGTTARISHVDAGQEAKGILSRYGWGGMARVLMRMVSLYLRSADYRAFVKGVREAGVVPEELGEYFGYGLYAGRK
jgi:arsenite methyltransferase